MKNKILYAATFITFVITGQVKAINEEQFLSLLLHQLNVIETVLTQPHDTINKAHLHTHTISDLKAGIQAIQVQAHELHAGELVDIAHNHLCLLEELETDNSTDRYLQEQLSAIEQKPTSSASFCML